MHVLYFLIICILKCSSSENTMDYKFPNAFMFGASTAAYQIEGGWNKGGKFKVI